MANTDVDKKVSLKETLIQAAALVDEELTKILSDEECKDAPEILIDAMRYATIGGGKKVRAFLTLEFCRLFGGKPQDAIPCAAAIELLHSATLVHDDMPEMDNSPMRRGKESVHMKYGSAVALQTGNALTAKAFEVAAKQPHAAEITAELALSIGPCGISGGQTLDILMEKQTKAAKIGDIKRLHALKTAALMISSCRVGCITAGDYDLETLKTAEAYGKALGLAFQITDDILDATESPETLGKPVGSDAAAGKKSFLTALTLGEAKIAAGMYTEEANKIARELGSNYLLDLAAYLSNRKL
jgi:geranylgeranyl pyrophosphate synthase